MFVTVTSLFSKIAMIRIFS